MSSARVIKHKRVDTKSNVEVKNRPTRADTKPASQLKVTCSRKARASSCPRTIRRGSDPSKKQRIEGEKCERRARSTSAAPTPRAGQKVTAASPKSTDILMKTPLKTEEYLITPGQKDRPTRSYYALQSHKAFTVIPPNPKKRKEIQKKAEAELAALEDLRLSRAMAYVSINPSSVGGCLSLEEVRLKQQQDMQARRRQKQMRKYLLEATPVLP